MGDDRAHRPRCPTVDSPLTGPDACTCPPPTPSLDKIAELRPISEKIGEFLAEHLVHQGIVPARCVWVRYPCWKDWTRGDGELVAAGLLVPDDQLETIDAFDCPCPAPEDAPGPHMKRELWAIGLHDDWINAQLARFFGLDPTVIEAERTALLEWVRAQNERSHDG